MIPSLIVFGLVVGRWWRTTLVVASIGWPAVLLATDVVGFGRAMFGAAALGFANALVGVLVHHAVGYAMRTMRRSVGSAPLT